MLCCLMLSNESTELLPRLVPALSGGDMYSAVKGSHISASHHCVPVEFDPVIEF